MFLPPEVVDALLRLDPSLAKFKDTSGKITVQLQRALYGCIESAKLWYTHLAETFTKDGFVANLADPCVFNKTINNQQVTALVYVDDVFITSKSTKLVEGTAKLLETTYKTVTQHRGHTHLYLGMVFDFKLNPGAVTISMDKYVDELIDITKTTGSASSPAGNNLFTKVDSPALPEPRRKAYHSNIARILYLAKRTRPTLLTAVSFLTSRVNDATEDDEHKLSRLLRYINGSRRTPLILSAPNPIKLHCYIDASHAVHAGANSHAGFCTNLGGRGTILAMSKKIKAVAKSSTEAELYALAEFYSEVVGMRDFLMHQGYGTVTANIFEDNMSTIHLVNNGRSTSPATRHIAVRYFFLKSRLESGEATIEHCPTEHMEADVLTKPLQGSLYNRLAASINGLSPHGYPGVKQTTDKTISDTDNGNSSSKQHIK
jgi:hypothetical protein